MIFPQLKTAIFQGKPRIKISLQLPLHKKHRFRKNREIFLPRK
jgi:hypothetical protein